MGEEIKWLMKMKYTAMENTVNRSVIFLYGEKIGQRHKLSVTR